MCTSSQSINPTRSSRCAAWFSFVFVKVVGKMSPLSACMNVVIIGVLFCQQMMSPSQYSALSSLCCRPAMTIGWLSCVSRMGTMRGLKHKNIVRRIRICQNLVNLEKLKFLVISTTSINSQNKNNYAIKLRNNLREVLLKVYTLNFLFYPQLSTLNFYP